jgi:predicted dehydrogenase
MTETRQIRIGIVGVGGIAQNQHIPGYLRRCQDVEIVALCDIDEDKLKSVGARYGVPRLTTDYRELVRMEDLDAVDICTLPDMHHPVAMAAIERGKHVFCEKPLALTYPLATQMYKVAEAAGVKTGVGFTHRMTPAARLAQRMISSGALGDIYHVIAIYAMGGAHFEELPMTRRRTRAVNGGGPLFELGSHMVDMVRWWLGQEIVAVCAQTRTFVRQRRWPGSPEFGEVDVEDASVFMADLEGGSMGLFINSSVFTARNFDQRVEVYGSRGAILYDQGRPYELRACVGKEMMEPCAGYGIYSPAWGLYRDEEPYPVIPVPQDLLDGRAAPWERPPTQTLTPHFVAALRGQDAPLLPTFYEGMKVQEVLDAVLLSAEERRWVTLPLSEG